MNIRTLLMISFIVFMVFGLAACSDNDSDTRKLETTLWELISYSEQGNVQSVLAGSTITAVFDGVVSTVYGSAGCNQYSGGFQVDGNILSISKFAVTLANCNEPEGIMEQEQWYLAALEAAESYEVQGKEVQIFSSDTRVLLFRSQ